AEEMAGRKLVWEGSEFRNTLTVPSAALAVTRSSLPSRLKSPTATARGWLPTVKSEAGPRVKAAGTSRPSSASRDSLGRQAGAFRAVRRRAANRSRSQRGQVMVVSSSKGFTGRQGDGAGAARAAPARPGLGRSSAVFREPRVTVPVAEGLSERPG